MSGWQIWKPKLSIKAPITEYMEGDSPPIGPPPVHSGRPPFHPGKPSALVKPSSKNTAHRGIATRKGGRKSKSKSRRRRTARTYRR
jgi:hypothetical protein